jgi:Family of unknown function (DUF6152)
MFDTDKQVTLIGTVKEFQWNNSHRWIQLLVADPKDANATPVEWGVRMGAPTFGLKEKGAREGGHVDV